MAYQISNTPASEISYVVSRVAFPAYARLQDEPQRLQQAYFRIMRLTIAVSVPVAVGIVFLASDFTNIFLGEKWLPMIPAIQLLGIAGLIKSIVATGTPLFTGSGKPNYEFHIQLIRAATMLICIYPLTAALGISGASFCVILSALGPLFVWYLLSQNMTRVRFDKYADAIAPPFLGAIFMGVSIYALSLCLKPAVGVLAYSAGLFLTIAVAGCLAYLVVLYLIGSCYQRLDIFADLVVLWKSAVSK
jgi:O-antigen/teichoic acid export membrane protein